MKCFRKITSIWCINGVNLMFVFSNLSIGLVVRMSILDTNVDGSIPSINIFSP